MSSPVLGIPAAGSYSGPLTGVAGPSLYPTPGYGAGPALASPPSAPASVTGLRQSWVTYVHPEYATHIDRWTLAYEHYTGSVLDPDKIIKYLPRKQQSEALDAYRERTGLADYTPHFATVVDSLAGMMFGIEGDAKRLWGKADVPGSGFGDPKEPGTIAYELTNNADGKGTGWITIWKQLVIHLLIARRAWLITDPGAGDYPLVHIAPVLAVRNWRYEGNRLVEAIVEEQADARSSLMDKPVFNNQYIHYKVDGWKRWGLSPTGREFPITGKNAEGTYHYEDRDHNPILPIFRVELPLNRDVGWMIAKKANAIFNQESARDFLIRSAQLAIKLNMYGSDTFIEKISQRLIESGTTVLQNDPASAKAHHYIAPEAAPADIASKVLERKVEEFYKIAFRAYSDSARGQQRTATEMKQEIAAGAGAILQLVKSTVDEAENQTFWRMEQIEWPDSPDKWGVAHVERSDNFALEDIDTLQKNLQDRYWGTKGNSIPVGRTALQQLAKQTAELDGLEADDEEIEFSVDAKLISDSLSIANDLPLGAEARVALTIRYVKSLGLFEWDQELDDEESGEKTTMGQLIEKQIRQVAYAEQAAVMQKSQFQPGQVPIGGGKLVQPFVPGGAGGPGGGGAGGGNGKGAGGAGAPAAPKGRKIKITRTPEGFTAEEIHPGEPTGAAIS